MMLIEIGHCRDVHDFISSCREGHGHRISLHAQRDAADHDWPPSARAPGIPTSTHQYPTCTWKCKKRTLHIEPSDLRGSEASGHYNSQMKIKEDPAHWALRFARGQASVQGLGHWETQNRHWETQVKLLYIQNLISGMTTIKTKWDEVLIIVISEIRFWNSFCWFS